MITLAQHLAAHAPYMSEANRGRVDRTGYIITVRTAGLRQLDDAAAGKKRLTS
ncbi:hypothetical protein ACFQNE_14110 [Gordonia phosphorivorans]|uniref:Uncharacterized protein n=1 Tax=Gordonia phosphorivorans TaxID=1056982 RepID=A0ABV6H7K3_9ACTN